MISSVIETATNVQKIFFLVSFFWPVSIHRHIYVCKKENLKSLAKPKRVRVPVAQGIYKNLVRQVNEI